MTTFPDLFRLEGRTAFVTGAAGFLGQEYAEALLEAGANVVFADVDGERAAAAAARHGDAHGDRAWSVVCDVASSESVEAATEAACGRFGRIDVLVNNAALTAKVGSAQMRDYFAPFEEYPLDVWERALAVNLTGVFLCCQAVGRRMAAQGRGSIINISSTYGLGGPDQRIYTGVTNPYDPDLPLNTPIPYSATKAAVLGVTRYLATYWGERGVRVNCLTPGGTYEEHEPAFVSAYSARVPMGRMAHHDEYRGAILFLASDASSYMTGANLVVDGGWTAW